MTGPGFTLRPATSGDADLLQDLVVAAVNWDPGRPAAARERVLGLDFDRADLGLGLRMREPPRPYGLSFALRVAPGRSTWGLTSFRNELGFGVYYGDVVRGSAHLHANYTMILRATGHDSLARALLDDVAALGFGPDVELALGPFPGWPRGFLAMRGGVDAFLPGGTSVFAGLALGFQLVP